LFAGCIIYAETKISSNAKRAMLRLTRKQLEQYNGTNQERILIAYQKRIYDVSRSELFLFGMHYEHQAGEDLTRELGDAPHGEEVFEKFEVVGELID
jgi:predicted heme/steroid binding protein